MTPLPKLPKLIDRAGLEEELGVRRSAADAIMRELPKVKIPGHSKLYVKRAAVQQLLEDGTIDVVTVRARKRRQAA